MALVCESLGVDVYDVIEFVNELPSRMMHIPGAGVGGHCLPKDPWLLKYGVDTYGKFKVQPNVIIKSRELNIWMPTHMVELLEEAFIQSGKDLRLVLQLSVNAGCALACLSIDRLVQFF